MSSSLSSSSKIGVEVKKCFCGVSARKCVSTKEKTKGKRFLGCRNYYDVDKFCGFFEWLDMPVGDSSNEMVVKSSNDEAISLVKCSSDEVILLTKRVRKLGEKLQKMEKKALKWELEAVKLGELYRKQQMCIVISWMITFAVISCCWIVLYK